MIPKDLLDIILPEVPGEPSDEKFLSFNLVSTRGFVIPEQLPPDSKDAWELYGKALLSSLMELKEAKVDEVSSTRGLIEQLKSICPPDVILDYQGMQVNTGIAVTPQALSLIPRPQ